MGPKRAHASQEHARSPLSNRLTLSTLCGWDVCHAGFSEKRGSACYCKSSNGKGDFSAAPLSLCALLFRRRGHQDHQAAHSPCANLCVQNTAIKGARQTWWNPTPPFISCVISDSRLEVDMIIQVSPGLPWWRSR